MGRIGRILLLCCFALLMSVPGAGLAGAAPPAPAASAPAADLIDINTATAEQLKTLPGMGDAYVKRIIDGRPYSAKNQLATKGILPKAAYDRIAEKIVARRQKL